LQDGVAKFIFWSNKNKGYYINTYLNIESSFPQALLVGFNLCGTLILSIGHYTGIPNLFGFWACAANLQLWFLLAINGSSSSWGFTVRGHFLQRIKQLNN
jgi:hypothetical protein